MGNEREANAVWWNDDANAPKIQLITTQHNNEKFIDSMNRMIRNRIAIYIDIISRMTPNPNVYAILLAVLHSADTVMLILVQQFFLDPVFPVAFFRCSETKRISKLGYTNLISGDLHRNVQRCDDDVISLTSQVILVRLFSQRPFSQQPVLKKSSARNRVHFLEIVELYEQFRERFLNSFFSFPLWLLRFSC